MTAVRTDMRLVRAGIDTYRQPVAYMHEDCTLCRAEGFSALTRVEISLANRSVVAALNVVTGAAWLPPDTAGLSDVAWAALRRASGDALHSRIPSPRHHFADPDEGLWWAAERSRLGAIIADTVGRRLSDLDLAAFVTACAGDRLERQKPIALTRAMRAAGALRLGCGTSVWISIASAGCRATGQRRSSSRSWPPPGT